MKTTQKRRQFQHPASHTAESHRSKYLKNLYVFRSSLADLSAPPFLYSSSRPFRLATGVCLISPSPCAPADTTRASTALARPRCLDHRAAEMATEAAPEWLDKGDNAWQLAAMTLVGLQSVPTLAADGQGKRKGPV